jgi:Flp pilus assembly pilin Flp
VYNQAGGGNASAGSIQLGAKIGEKRQSFSRTAKGSNMLTKLYVKANDFARGQTMAEYALILAAVAVVVYVGYQTMGTTITTLLGSVDTSL